MDKSLTARHEATHSVVARELGFEFCIASIAPVVVRQRLGDESRALGVVGFPPDLESDLDTDPIERRADWVIVELVGVEFDARHYGEDRVGVCEGTDALVKIAKLTQGSPQPWEERVELYRQRARDMLDRPDIRRRVDVVGAALVRDKTPTMLAVDQLIAESDAADTD